MSGVFSARSVLGFARHGDVEEVQVPCVWAGYPLAFVGFGSATLTAFPTSQETTGRGCRGAAGMCLHA